MSREDGFSVADHAVRFLRDPKVVRALRRAGPESVIAYIAVRDASWENGRRICFDDAVDPLPFTLDDPESVRAVLADVGLLDAEGCIPEKTWTDWFGSAWTQRAQNRERWRTAKANQRSPRGVPPDSNGSPHLPTVPLSPSVPSIPVREDGSKGPMRTLRETLTSMGLRPEGEA